jgi:hypothetical protein
MRLVGHEAGIGMGNKLHCNCALFSDQQKRVPSVSIAVTVRKLFHQSLQESKTEDPKMQNCKCVLFSNKQKGKASLKSGIGNALRTWSGNPKRTNH